MTQHLGGTVAKTGPKPSPIAAFKLDLGGIPFVERWKKKATGPAKRSEVRIRLLYQITPHDGWKSETRDNIKYNGDNKR